MTVSGKGSILVTPWDLDCWVFFHSGIGEMPHVAVLLAAAFFNSEETQHVTRIHLSRGH